MEHIGLIHNIKRNSMARRLLIYILVASSGLTLLITTFQLYIDYQNDVSSIETRLVKINESSSKVLAQGMWDLDKKQVKNMLKGILEFSDIQYLEVVSVLDGIFVQAGTIKEQNVISANFPLVYNGKNIGIFNITATLDGVYDRLQKKVLLILCSQSIKTFFISVFILFIVQFILTRHLRVMAEYTGQLDINNLEKELSLKRFSLKNKKPDELQMVVNAINGMRLNLIQDIEIQKKQEMELIYLRNYLSNIIDSMPSILVGVDADGHVTQWNKTAEQRTGFSVGQAKGKKLFDFLPQLASLEDKITKSIKTGKVIQEQKKKFHSQKGIRYEDITIYPLKEDIAEGAVIRLDDTTEQVKMEEMMVQSEKMLSVGGLAAGMAHEINNPLAGMMQNAEVMRNRITSKEITANRTIGEETGIDLDALNLYMEKRGILGMLDSICTSGRRLSDIVDNMLNFSRKSEAVISPENIPGLLDDTIGLAVTDYDLKKEYDFKKIEIKREYENGMPSVLCERTKMQQVFLNIIRNCAQAMQEAKTLSPVLILRVYINDTKDYAVIEIEDNGPGMDEETCKRIFEPFFTTKPEGVGTGLGLSVSYFIVTENHNGTMNVESIPGSGSTFITRLPLNLSDV